MGTLYILYSSSDMDDWDQIQKVSVFTFIHFTVRKPNFTVFWKARLEVIVNRYHLKRGGKVYSNKL